MLCYKAPCLGKATLAQWIEAILESQDPLEESEEEAEEEAEEAEEAEAADEVDTIYSISEEVQPIPKHKAMKRKHSPLTQRVKTQQCRSHTPSHP